MTKPNNKSTVKEMKDYIRTNKLNHPKVKLGMRKAEMIAGLKKIGHFEDNETTPKKATPKKVTPKKVTPKKATPKKVTPKKATPKKVKINKMKRAELQKFSEKLTGNQNIMTGSFTMTEVKEMIKTIFNKKFVLKNNLTEKEHRDLPFRIAGGFYDETSQGPLNRIGPPYFLFKSEYENKSQEFLRNKINSLLEEKEEKKVAPKAKDTLSKITKKISLNDFLQNLAKISKAPRFIKIEDNMTDNEISDNINWGLVNKIKLEDKEKEEK